jgi:hypothetical protein
LINYSFIAKLTRTGVGEGDDGSSIGSRLSKFKSKILEIVFIPYVDPALELPPVSRFAPKKPEKSSKGKNLEAGRISPSSKGEPPANGFGGPGPSKLPKPTLTLTTADLPLSASSNSTPIIDKPRPLDTSIVRTVAIKDDNGQTLARLTVELPKTKFLPDDEMSMLVRLVTKGGDSMPKAFGVRVVERRCLARADPESADGGEEAISDDEEEDGLPKLNAISKERSRVLTRKKLPIHPEDTRTVEKSDIGTPDTNKAGIDVEADKALIGGKKIEQLIRVRLPAFKTFINDMLLPTVTLPLGSLTGNELEDQPTIGNMDGIPDLSRNKGKSPAYSSAATSPTTARSIPLIPSAKGLNFVVAHILQVTVPINGSWFKKSTSSSKDLEVAIPIVLGNINPQAPNKKKVSEFRLKALEERRYGIAGSSRSSRKSSIGSSSGHGGNGSAKLPAWKEGERFLTLNETDVRPSFIKES